MKKCQKVVFFNWPPQATIAVVGKKKNMGLIFFDALSIDAKKSKIGEGSDRK